MKRALACLIAAIAVCASADSRGPPSTAPGCDNEIVNCMEQRTPPPPTVIAPAKKYTAIVHTSRGDFTITFVDPNLAPQTVNNFVYLSQNHYYDGLTFHRVVPGFVVQGGDPLGNGTGGPPYKHPPQNNPFEGPRRTAGAARVARGRVPVDHPI